MKLRMTSDKWQVASDKRSGSMRELQSCHASRVMRAAQERSEGGCHPAFTLIELTLVLALLVVITSLAAPAMSNFIRGRALDSEARRLMALMHAGQSRAVSEGLPMVLWVDEKQGAYGLQAETTGQTGDPKAENVVGGFDAANRRAEYWIGHADDVQQFAGHPVFGGRHGGRKQSADIAIDGCRRRFALAGRNTQPPGL